MGLPSNILLREAPGLLIMFLTFAVIPPLLAKTALRSFYERLGSTRYAIFVVLMIFGALLPLKMYLRWFFNLKYIISMPEFFFNF
jgi:hypothetical protein